MYCQTCGDLIPDDSSFCPSCGKRLGSATPQTEEEPLEYAGFAKRFLANIVDNVILLVLSFMVAFMVGLCIAFLPIAVSPAVYESEGLAFAIFLLCAYFYYAYLESSPQQATFGKRAVGIAVTDAEGERITFGRATVRFIGKFLSRFVFPVFIVIAITEKKQGLHDMAAGTLVVRKKV